MARCKDCVHYEACSAFSKIINSAREVEKGCEYFKDLTKYVEVVRCKDCVYRHDSCFAGSGNTYCDKKHTYSPLDGFCSYGERKDDG